MTVEQEHVFIFPSFSGDLNFFTVPADRKLTNIKESLTDVAMGE